MEKEMIIKMNKEKSKEIIKPILRSKKDERDQ
jgi:hypothetical protein